MVGFGERLKKVRKAKGLTQDDLGKMADVHPRHISKYETGRATPTVEYLKRIAETLKVSTDWLIFGENGLVEGQPKIKNLKVLEKVSLIEKMDKADQEIVLKLIDAMAVKNQVKSTLSKLS